MIELLHIHKYIYFYMYKSSIIDSKRFSKNDRLIWWLIFCLKRDFICAFEYLYVCVCAVAFAYIYVYICTYNGMHLYIYTYISGVYCWEEERQRKKVWEGKSRWECSGKRIVTIRMISFYLDPTDFSDS